MLLSSENPTPDLKKTSAILMESLESNELDLTLSLIPEAVVELLYDDTLNIDSSELKQ